MRTNAIVILLVLACIGLGVVLAVDKKHHDEETQQRDNTIMEYSNHVISLEGKLREQTNVNYTLSTNLAESEVELDKASNDLASLQSNLSTAQANLEKSQTDAKAAAEKATADLAEKDKKISDLENQNQELDKQSANLRNSIADKETQIQDTQKKLDAAEGDKTLLLAELKRLQAEKADLESKFNDLVALKEQVRKLKDDLTTARKLDWIRRGIYDSIRVKGGELLMHPELASTSPPPTNANMSVEIRQSGGVSVGTNGVPAN